MGFVDFAPCDYFNDEFGDWYGIDFSEFLRAVGWIDRDSYPHENYPRGEISELFFEWLNNLIMTAWNPCYSLIPVYQCDFCAGKETSAESRFPDYKIRRVSGTTLFIPGEGVIYVAPGTILHFIDAHSYHPPWDFARAVMTCPKMGSLDYLKALVRNGGKKFHKVEKEFYKDARSRITNKRD